MRLLVTVAPVSSAPTSSGRWPRSGRAITVLDALTYAGSRESLRALPSRIRVVEGDPGRRSAGEQPDRRIGRGRPLQLLKPTSTTPWPIRSPFLRRHRDVLDPRGGPPARRATSSRISDEVYGDLPLDRAFHRIHAISRPARIRRPRPQLICSSGPGSRSFRARDDLELLEQLQCVPARREVHPGRSPTC